jgi:plastocyanin
MRANGLLSKLILLLFISFTLAGCGSGRGAANNLPAPTAIPPTATNLIFTLTAVRATVTPVPPTPTALVPSPTSSPNAVDVRIIEPPFKPTQAWTFDPVTITVKVGTHIHWMNSGAILHTVTADDKQTFNSGDLQPQAGFDFTPTSAGTITYHCNYHPWMKGTVIVEL